MSEASDEADRVRNALYADHVNIMRDHVAVLEHIAKSERRRADAFERLVTFIESLPIIVMAAVAQAAMKPPTP